MTLTEIVRLRPQEQAKFQCSACGADRGCDCNAPAVEKLARKAEQDRINQRAYRERKRAALDNAPIDFVKDSPSAEALLVLARTAIVHPFREERPGPGSRLDRVAGRRIGCSRAARAAAEQDRDRFFIGPGWLKEPRVRITRKGRRR
jgi:hypothetical protein